MADTDHIVGASVGVAVLFILFGAVIYGGYSSAQGLTMYEDVNTQDEWDAAINDAASSDYTLTDGVVTLNAAGVVETHSVSTQSHDYLRVESDHLSGDVDLTVYDGEDDTVLDSVSVSGDTTATLQVQDYDAESYYLEAEETTGTEDAEVTSYEVEGDDDRDSRLVALLLMVMVLFLVGVAKGLY